MAELVEVENSIEKIIESLRELGIIVEDFQEGSQQLLFDSINELVRDFKAIDDQKEACGAHEIPIDVLSFIDQGHNPDLYTNRALAECIQTKLRTQGKVEALTSFKENVSESLEAAGMLAPDEGIQETRRRLEQFRKEQQEQQQQQQQQQQQR